MAGFKMYVRFVGPRRSYVGTSKYRPSEGWIDVLSYRWGLGVAKDFFVIVGDDPAVGHLYLASTKAEAIDSAVFEMRDGVKWFRFVMSDVVIDSVQTGRGGETPFVSEIAFTYKKRTESYGGYPSAKGQSVAQARN